MLSPRRNQANLHAMTILPLDSRLVRHRSNALWPIAFHRHGPRLPWHRWLPLQIHLFALLLRLPSLLCVVLHATEEFVSTARVSDVLDPDIDSLFHEAVINLLVTGYAERRFGDVIYNASFSVIDLVGHAFVRVSHVLLSFRGLLAFLHSAIGNDVNNVPDMIRLEVDG